MSADESSRIQRDSLKELKARPRTGGPAGVADHAIARYLSSVQYAAVRADERTDERRPTTPAPTRPPVYETTMHELAVQPTAVVRTELPAADLPSWLAAAYHTVLEYLQHRGAHPTGPPFARFASIGDTVAAEAGFPVPEEIDGDGYVVPSTLPGGPAAVTTHLGRYEDLERAYRAVHDWVAATGYEPAGAQWEVYYTDPNAEPNPARWRTDVVVPCRRAGARARG